MKKYAEILICLQILWSGSALAQTFQAVVNRTEIPQGETFLLTLETDDDKTNASPDLSVLEKDFTIYSVGNAYQSSYVNGVTTHSRQWQIILMPKNAGKIEIPAIKLGKLQSEPVTLNVLSANLSGQGGQQSVSADEPKFAVDAAVDNKNPYVQQQINYSFKIYDSGGLHGEEPVVMDNGSSDWIVKSLGEPKVNTKVINGRQLREIEFKYALFPQKSGSLKTPDLEFNGYYLTRSRRGASAFDDVFNSGFFNIGFSDMFAARNPVVLRPEPITIDVKPVPAAGSGYWWLPASQVVLTSEWENGNPVFRVGEAVSRSVYLKAAGVTESQLPDIKFASMEGMRQYPDKPLAMSSQVDGMVISIKKFGNVFIPERAGEVTIPAVSVDWYNIHSGKIEKAQLPAQKITVLPAVGGGEEMPSKQSLMTENNGDNTPAARLLEQTARDAARKSAPEWTWVVTAFVLGGVLSYLLFGYTRSGRRDYVKAVEKAAAHGDVRELRDNLLEWARLAYNDMQIHNLEDIAAHSETEVFKTQLQQIGKALYAPNKNGFSGGEFIRAFREERSRRRRKIYSVPLPRLYD